jgi:hypothetical protein
MSLQKVLQLSNSAKAFIFSKRSRILTGLGAWLRLGILVAFGGMWIESVVFSLLLSRG